MRKPLALLDDVDVASPCHADWDGMIGGERARHCNQCDKNVYDLSEMTHQEALNFVREREGDVCIRFHRRRDGTMLTSDCPVGAERKSSRKRRTVGIFASLASLFFFGCTKEQSADDELPGDANELQVEQLLEQKERTMGKMMLPDFGDRIQRPGLVEKLEVRPNEVR